jgi:hypothetical protein
VRWIDLPKPDGSKVDHPAPILKLQPATTPVSLTRKDNMMSWLAIGIAAAAHKRL